MGNKTSKLEAGNDTKSEEDIVEELIKNLENIKNKDIPTVLEKLKKVKGKISSDGESKEGSEEKEQAKAEEIPPKGDSPPTTGQSASSSSTTSDLPTPPVDSTKKGGTKKRLKKRDTVSDFNRTRSLRLV